MRPDLSDLIDRYIAFEKKVQNTMSRLCAPFCAACEKVCCKSWFCEETVDSIFLSQIRQRYFPQMTYSRENGWLSETGCRLSCGRPPVCYEFICEKILSAHPDSFHRYLIEVLSLLITHAGKRALGNMHIVELETWASLNKIDADKVAARISESENALKVIDGYFNRQTVSMTDIERLNMIKPPRRTKFTLSLQNSDRFRVKASRVKL